MYLTNRDIRWAILSHIQIVRPTPEELGAGYDETSINLHLDAVGEARVWNTAAYQLSERQRGRRRPEFHSGQFDFLAGVLTPPPEDDGASNHPVSRRGTAGIVRPGW